MASITELEYRAEAGDLSAMKELAMLYRQEAEKLLAKRIKALTEQAEDGDPEAMWEVALAYENGEGVEKDLAIAQQWFSRAQKQYSEGRRMSDE